MLGQSMFAAKNKKLRSFKSQLIVSFISLGGILLLWILVYSYINFRQRSIHSFVSRLSGVAYRNSESCRNLQDFLIYGYKQPTLYSDNKEKNIDKFFTEQQELQSELITLEKHTARLKIGAGPDLEDLKTLHSLLSDSTKRLRRVMVQKGFFDYGTEGTMRSFAHWIEDSGLVAHVDILMLRRHEKDFIMRGQQKYSDLFNHHIDSLLDQTATGTPTYQCLLQYKKYFNLFVYYAMIVDINGNNGLYAHVEEINRRLADRYAQSIRTLTKRVDTIDSFFRLLLWGCTLLLLAGFAYTSNRLAKLLSDGVSSLNNKVSAYIKNMFVDYDDTENKPKASRIKEIAHLNENFKLMSQTMKVIIFDLENKIREEKESSSKLAITVEQLSRQNTEIEFQRKLTESSEAKLNAFFSSSDSCYLMVDRLLNITAFNKVAFNFFRNFSGRELALGENISAFIKEPYTEIMSNFFREALNGKHLQEEFYIKYVSPLSTWWYIGFVPAHDGEGNIFGVSLTATNIDELKMHMDKIKVQSAALNSIAHVQSHEIRGPIATILGLMDLIKDDNYSPEYLDMLDEAVKNFDKKIHRIVRYTEKQDPEVPEQSDARELIDA